MHGTEIYLGNEWGWDKDETANEIPRLRGMAGEDVKIGCRMISGSTHEKASQISVYNRASNASKTDRKTCASEKLDCWHNSTLVQPGFVICLWGHHNIGLSFQFKIDIMPKTTLAPITSNNMTWTPKTPASPVKNKETLSPQISEMGPYVIKNTGQQQVLFNPSPSLNKSRTTHAN